MKQYTLILTYNLDSPKNPRCVIWRIKGFDVHCQNHIWDTKYIVSQLRYHT